MSVQTHKLIIDKKYFFSFHEDIAALNGIYSVLAILNFKEVEVFLSDPVQDLYVAVNKLDLYDSGKLEQKYREEVFYKLQSTEDSEVVWYVPDSLIVDYPLSDFKTMKEYTLYVQIGIINDPEELKALVPIVNQVVLQTIGVDPITSIASFGEQHLPPETIDQHTVNRNLLKTTKTVYTQLDEARAQISKYRAIISKYEKIIKAYEESKNNG